MARGTTVSTGLSCFVGNPDIGGSPKARGTGTKLAMGFNGVGATTVTFTVIGDIQPKGGTPPSGSSFGTALPITDVIKSAFLAKIAGAAPVDVTSKASIAADNSVKISGCTALQSSNAYLFVLFDEANKMGAAN